MGSFVSHVSKFVVFSVINSIILLHTMCMALLTARGAIWQNMLNNKQNFVLNFPSVLGDTAKVEI